MGQGNRRVIAGELQGEGGDKNAGVQLTAVSIFNLAFCAALACSDVARAVEI